MFHISHQTKCFVHVSVRQNLKGKGVIYLLIFLTMKKISNNEFVLNKDEYARLLYQERKIEALERAGVDNWCWYGETEDWDDEDTILEELDTIII